MKRPELPDPGIDLGFCQFGGLNFFTFCFFLKIRIVVKLTCEVLFINKFLIMVAKKDMNVKGKKTFQIIVCIAE